MFAAIFPLYPQSRPPTDSLHNGKRSRSHPDVVLLYCKRRFLSSLFLGNSKFKLEHALVIRVSFTVSGIKSGPISLVM